MMLAAAKGSRIVLETDGPDEMEALGALTALIALKDPHRRSRVAARWLLRLLEEHRGATIEEAAFAASALAALGGPSREMR